MKQTAALRTLKEGMILDTLDALFELLTLRAAYSEKWREAVDADLHRAAMVLENKFEEVQEKIKKLLLLWTLTNLTGPAYLFGSPPRLTIK